MAETRPAPPRRIPSVLPLNLIVTDPPTRAEVQAIADKLDELIAALSR